MKEQLIEMLDAAEKFNQGEHLNGWLHLQILQLH
jgi:hypothetical protein